MTKTYRVWVEIEKIDEENDCYENMGEPVPIASFDTLEEAEMFQQTLYEESLSRPIGSN